MVEALHLARARLVTARIRLLTRPAMHLHLPAPAPLALRKLRQSLTRAARTRLMTIQVALAALLILRPLAEDSTAMFQVLSLTLHAKPLVMTTTHTPLRGPTQPVVLPVYRPLVASVLAMVHREHWELATVPLAPA